MNGCRVAVFCFDVPIFPTTPRASKNHPSDKSDVVRLSDEDAATELL
jgi:hypothetical protein